MLDDAPAMLLALLAMIAAPADASPPPAPPVLAPYVRDGVFDPGDYQWLRGRFDGATPEQQAAFASIGKWLGECFEWSAVRTRAELAELGVTEIKLEYPPMRDPLCRQVASLASAAPAGSFADFERAAAEARPYAETYQFAVAIAEKVVRPRDASIAAQIGALPTGEQMLRFAAGWGSGEAAAAPKLSPAALAILQSRIAAGMVVADHRNTEWLKGMVEAQGWPKISEVGEGASGTAWLLAQHADAQPAFQLKVLRLMEPMAATGEVSKRNYAYLYDRVMLVVTGKQRYATQFMGCSGGKRMLRPLEDEAAVDRQRAAMGLEPFAEYAAGTDRMYGPCPPG